MKKTYVKPEIAIESFMMTQSIARYCDGHNNVGYGNHYNPASCTFSNWMEDDINFSEAPCTLIIPEGTPVEGVCYQNGAAGMNIFAST